MRLTREERRHRHRVSLRRRGPSFVKNGRDVLFVRPDAVFDKSKPISGGLPHCWPQFGPGDLQTHGFARNVDWALTDTTEGDSSIR